MELFSIAKEYILGFNSFFYLRDIVEIIFFSVLIYYFSLWLKKDKQKNLLPYFYGYSFLAITAYYAQLTAVTYFLFLFSPVAIMIFILLHQQQLQKNFVALKNIKPAKQITTEWAETLIRSCLVTINNNKQIYCVIEQQDKLEDFVTAGLRVDADLNQQLIKILQESDLFEQEKMIWINTRGKIVGINCTWKIKIEEEQIGDEIRHLELWKQQAILMSTKTDALFFKITPTTRAFDIIFNGKMVDHVHATNALNIIRKYASTDFWTKKPIVKRGDVIYEARVKKNTTEQLTR